MRPGSPGKVIDGLEPVPVGKRLTDKGFAPSVNRDDVYRGAEEVGVDLNEHVAFVIKALEGIAPRIGLAGSSA